MTTHLIARISLATSIACMAAPLRAQDADIAKYASQVCASCHGPRGESISPGFPKLAGQRAEYLVNQLKAFRDRTRADPMAQAYMWGMTSQLSDDSIRKLAAFYSGQKPAAGKARDAKLAQQGKAVFDGGIPSAKVQACKTCHGANAEGNAIFPRLAGQHAEYLVKQLVLFKSSMREGGNAPIMHAISTGMTFEQMEAVAAYLASK
ncbi:MAG TPA: c-type cytochrome [Burkholderiales bacterium]|nr:c-type cytochrome [Burkholderiales bacterium]